MAQKSQQAIAINRKVSVERNLDSWPLWTPVDSRVSHPERRFEREIRLPDGTIAAASVIVRTVTSLGPLTTEDQKVLFALLEIWQDSGRPETITFSLAQLCRRLKRSWGSIQREAIRKSLDRLADTPMEWVRAFFDSQKQEHLSVLEKFRILDRLRIVRREFEKTNTAECEASFHPLALANLRNFHTRPVLLDVVLNIRSGIAQLLYRYADPLLTYNAVISRRSEDLFQDLGLDAAKYSKAANRRNTLKRAILELDGIALSSGGTLICHLGRTKSDDDYLVIFKKKLGKDDVIALDVGEVISDEPMSHDDDSSPEGLVAQFYRAFHGRNQQATPKELRHARRVIEELGPEGTRILVEYALTESRGSNYRPETFGGIVQYVPGVLEALSNGSIKPDLKNDAAPICKICNGTKRVQAQFRDGRIEYIGCPHSVSTLEKWQIEKGIKLIREHLHDAV